MAPHGIIVANQAAQWRVRSRCGNARGSIRVTLPTCAHRQHWGKCAMRERQQHPNLAVTLDEVITEYLLKLEQGEPPDRQCYLERYPQWATDLQAFFTDHDRVAAALRGASSSGVQQGDTVSLGTAAQSGLGSPSSVPSVERGEIEFGEYELVEEIARGGMGVVYKARQRRLNRTVALKMILSGQLANEAEVQRFYAEAEAAARLEHSGIVPIHEIGQLQGLHYYTMSFIEGRSLADLLRDGPLPAVEAATLVKKVALAMAYAHAHHVIHRDLKPANILIDPHGEPKVTDFGLAKRTDSGDGLTATGQILGTLQYMAPEQATARSREVTAAADVYALGAVLYAALTGRPPFKANHHVDLLLQVLEAEPTSPRKHNPLVPRELERVCRRCLEKDPQRRYPSAAALAEDLNLFLRGEPLQGASPSVIDTVRRLPRRGPALCAHWCGILLVELFRQSRLLFGSRAVLEHDWAYHWQFTGIFAFWAVVCLALHWLSGRPRWTELGRAVWAIVDVAFMTWVLALAHGPIGPLFAAFALLIVGSGSFFRVRLVGFMTAACVAAYVVLLWLRPEEARPLHYAAVTGAVFVIIGMIMAYHVHRLRTLYQYYERQG